MQEAMLHNVYYLIPHRHGMHEHGDSVLIYKDGTANSKGYF